MGQYEVCYVIAVMQQSDESPFFIIAVDFSRIVTILLKFDCQGLQTYYTDFDLKYYSQHGQQRRHNIKRKKSGDGGGP